MLFIMEIQGTEKCLVVRKRMNVGDSLASLIKTYHDKGGYHIQFNVVSSETLRDAQQNSEMY